MLKCQQNLDRIAVKGFKSIRDVDLKLRPLNILIGANGSGKSNFIQAFEMLNNIINKRLQVFVARAGRANNLLYFGRRVTQQVEIHLEFGANGYNTILEPTDDDNLFFSEEHCWYHGPGYSEPYRIDLGSGHRETRLYEESSQSTYRRIADYVIESIESWRLYQFHDTSDSARVKQTGDLSDNTFLRSDASNLAAFLYFLQEAHRAHYDQIVKTVRLVAPFFQDFALRPSPFNQDKIQLEWEERGSDDYFNASALSDGTLRFMSLATLLLQPDLPATILIDEPELGLHPYAITLLASLLQQAATKTQVIVATQSVPLVNQFTPEDIIVVDREGDLASLRQQSTFRRLETPEYDLWLDEYGLGDLWEKNVIGGRPRR